MENKCFVPQLNTEIITLGHGSGGQLTTQLLDKIIFEILQDVLIAQTHDGGVFEIDGKIAISTDSFVVSPIFFPNSNIGDLAVNGTVNDLAMCGAKPVYLSLAFIIEEGLRVEDFIKILESIKVACQSSGVQIITGDTKVVEKGKGDYIFINTTGIGKVLENANIDLNRIEPEDLIIVSNQIADHGMAIMSKREGLEFDSDIISDSINLNDVTEELITEIGEGVKLLKDPTRGGVATVLNEIAQARELGVELDETQIKVNQSTKSACEILGLDPLFVANEGVFIAIINPEFKEKTLHILNRYQKCSNAFTIGKFVSEHPKKVVMTNGMGGKRVITKLIGDQLPRIC